MGPITMSLIASYPQPLDYGKGSMLASHMLIQSCQLQHRNPAYGRSVQTIVQIQNKNKYERVQSVGLTSLSYNWVILHKDMDQT